jgi:hypothetical protein
MGWGAVMRAMPALFAIYVVEACAALVLGIPSGLRALADAPQGHDALAMAQWLETIAYWGPVAKTAGVTGLLLCGVVALLSPWLHMTWLSALSRPEPLSVSLAQGARLWVRASLVTLLVGLGTCLAALPWGLAAWGLQRALPQQDNARVHDLALALCIASALPLLWLGHLWHDLARARALFQGCVRATLGSLRAALRPALTLNALIWTLLGWACVAFSHWHVGNLSKPLMQVALLQSAILVRLITRARWLAQTLAYADESERLG